VPDNNLLLRRYTCTEHTRVTRRNFARVPSQQVKILSSKAVNQGGKYSDMKSGLSDATHKISH